jgi:RNA polymerase sigma-70 factor, ECF subfamily
MSTARQAINAQLTPMTSPSWFAEAFERHHAAVYRAALRVTGSPADAEDVLQTIFLRILNMKSRPDLPDLCDAYFRRAATNAALDLIRRRTAHPEVPIVEEVTRAAGQSPSLLKERLRRALALLEENDAALFLMRFVEGFSNSELAGIFGIEKNNVAVRLHRIRHTLQTELER